MLVCFVRFIRIMCTARCYRCRHDVPRQLKEDLPGTPRHYHWDMRKFMDEQLRGNWMELEGLTSWPPRSPDLSPLDFFFFWVFVKDYVYMSPLS